MFIKDLVLENFQNLQTGLGITKLHIDFTKQKNPVCIIIGPMVQEKRVFLVI